jgi:hypothetical protein
LFADGLFEGVESEAGQDALESGLLDTLRAGLRVGLSEQADALLRTFERAVGGRPRNDVTFLLLQPE